VQLAAAFADQIEGPAVGVGQLLGADEDHLQEAVVIALGRQRDAEFDQPPVRDFPVFGRRVTAMVSSRPTAGVPFVGYEREPRDLQGYKLCGHRRLTISALPYQIGAPLPDR